MLEVRVPKLVNEVRARFDAHRAEDLGDDREIGATGERNAVERIRAAVQPLERGVHAAEARASSPDERAVDVVQHEPGDAGRFGRNR
jgi:hypothetical protein